MIIKIGKRKVKVKKFERFAIFKGLMFNFKDNAILVFDKEKEVSMHTFFCSTLFLIFLNKQKRIVDFKLLRPFKFYNCKKKVKYVIELQINSYKKVKNEIKLHKKVSFIEK